MNGRKSGRRRLGRRLAWGELLASGRRGEGSGERILLEQREGVREAGGKGAGPGGAEPKGR